jgi:hypothetical protein
VTLGPERPPFLDAEQWSRLSANGRLRGTIADAELEPVVRLDNPDGVHRWLLASVDPDNPARAFGLIDLGTGMPELGEVSLAELAAFRGRKGSPIASDPRFVCKRSLGEYTGWARLLGWILS